MISLKRNERKIYLCKKIVVDEIDKYSEPLPIYCNYQPIDSNGELLSVGLDESMYLKVTYSKNLNFKFENGDRCYIFVDKPETYDPLCKGYDFVVSGNPKDYVNNYQVTLIRENE